MLLEGVSVRAASRLTGLDKNTILRLVVQAGDQCAYFLEKRLINIPADEIQCDEQWTFVFAKEKTARRKHLAYECGDNYVFTALDRATKLLVCFHMGKRTPEHCDEFSRKLARAIVGRPMISTDGYKPYYVAIPEAFGHKVDHGILVKEFASPPPEDQRRYSPAQIVRIRIIHNAGNVDPDRVCTSHVERHNLSNRMHNRRFARLTSAFSKKLDNHHAMFALYAAWYNFVRVHLTLETTPAVAAGITDAPWTLERLLREVAIAA
jgi:IS1 family transposase